MNTVVEKIDENFFESKIHGVIFPTEQVTNFSEFWKKINYNIVGIENDIITKVKKNTNNTIFTIDDVIYSTHTPSRLFSIKSFTEKNNEILVYCDEIGKNRGYSLSLENIEKFKFETSEYKLTISNDIGIISALRKLDNTLFKLNDVVVPLKGRSPVPFIIEEFYLNSNATRILCGSGHISIEKIKKYNISENNNIENNNKLKEKVFSYDEMLNFGTHVRGYTYFSKGKTIENIFNRWYINNHIDGKQ